MRIFTTLFLAFFCWQAHAQRAIVISSIPANTPPGAVLYLAGSANNWNPGDPEWTFAPWNGQYILSVPASAPQSFQGKITRGSWATVEGNATGGFLPNRNLNFAQGDTLYLQVLSWEGAPPPPSDLPPNVVVLDDAFYMPQLDRYRRVRLFLPTAYHDTELHYPVLYMHDGQNLFSAQEAFAGEWKVDEAMLAFEAQGYPGAIIVAIDHGGSQRINEYTPWANSQYGGGQGALYSEFIVETLKPFVDAHYRTLPGRETTGIMGSSLGGLISHYSGMQYQDIFARVGVFSPSFWFNSAVYTHSATQGKQAPAKYYFLAGGQESANLVSQVNQMVATLSTAGFTQDELRFDVHPNGQHSEWFWAQQFPAAFEWLFMQGDPSGIHLAKAGILQVYPNPTDALLHIHLPEGTAPQWVYCVDSTGRSYSLATEDGRADLSAFPPGLYLLRVSTPQGIYTHKVVKR
jgi:metallo-beta-lactamase class B